MVATSKVSTGRPRSVRYATKYTTRPSPAPTAIPTNTARYIGRPSDGSSDVTTSFRGDTAQSAPKAPNMNISPKAKFTKPMMP